MGTGRLRPLVTHPGCAVVSSCAPWGTAAARHSVASAAPAASAASAASRTAAAVSCSATTAAVLHTDNQLSPSAEAAAATHGPACLKAGCFGCSRWCMGTPGAAAARAGGGGGPCSTAVLLAALDHDSLRSPSALLLQLLMRSRVKRGCCKLLAWGVLGDCRRCCCWWQDSVLGWWS